MVQVCYRYSNQQSAMMKTDAGTCASLSVSLLTTSSRLSNHFLLYTPIDLRFRLYQQSNQTSHSHASFSSYPCLWFMALIYVTNLELSLYLQWHSDWKLCTWSVDWCHIQRPLMTPTQRQFATMREVRVPILLRQHFFFIFPAVFTALFLFKICNLFILTLIYIFNHHLHMLCKVGSIKHGYNESISRRVHAVQWRCHMQRTCYHVPGSGVAKNLIWGSIRFN